MAGQIGASSRRMKRVADSDSEEEEEMPMPGALAKGKGRANGVNGHAGASAGNGDGGPSGSVDEDEDQPGWTISDFEPRPIGRERGIFEGFRKAINQMIQLRDGLQQTLERSTTAAKMIEEAQPGDAMIDEIDAGFRQTLDQIQVLEYRIEVMESMSDRNSAGILIEHPQEQFEQEVKVKVDRWKSLSERAKFKDNEEYKSFREGIWEVQNDDTACPPVSRWLAAGPDDDQNSDDEIEVGGRTQTFRCPLSLAPLKNAVTSLKCKHSYSKDAIMGVMKKKGRGAGATASVACPVPGCRVVLTAADLRDDPKLQKKADEFARRQATQTEADVSMAISVAGGDEDEDDDE